MLYGKMNLGLLVSAAIFSAACSGGSKKTAMGTYAYDRAFFAERGIETLELTSEDGASRVLVIPAYQGRVMTSSAAGDTGDSYGWINYKFIEKGELNPQFNPVGGEERFWIGPEGGPNSFYFKKGDEQVYANWKVPASHRYRYLRHPFAERIECLLYPGICPQVGIGPGLPDRGGADDRTGGSGRR